MNEMHGGETPPEEARVAVRKHSCTLADESVHAYGGLNVRVQGCDPPTVRNALDAMHTTGFQATAYARAREEFNRMLSQRQSPSGSGCTIFLALTSNLISSGVRDTVRALARWHAIDCIVTTAGAVEEDLVKCLGPTLLGSFSLDGATLRSHGLNRAGNLLIPNDNYCAFEDWLSPLLEQLHSEQTSYASNDVSSSSVWSPSSLCDRLGREMDSDSSILTWCHRNRIPVFCPALTDGSLGDMLYFHSYKHPGFVLDIVQDVRALNDLAVHAKPPSTTGMIILGGGVAKHHTCNANLMRNGADYAVYINTACEYDGSDSGASPDEAISWGKIASSADPVKLHADATLVFPLLVAETFTTWFQPNCESSEEHGTTINNCRVAA